MPQLHLVSSPAGHADPAWCVAFNPRRNLLASCSTDRTVRLYSYNLPDTSAGGHVHGPGCSHSHTGADGEAGFAAPSTRPPTVDYLRSIQTEHKRTIRSLAWAPSGRTLATGSFDSSVAVWEEADGAGSDGAEDEDEGENGVEGVFRPKKAEKRGGQDGEEDEDVDMLDGSEGGRGRDREWECVTTLEGHESECKAVGWSADGGLLASCSRDKSVWVWEVQPDSDFECIAVMMEHTQDVKSLAWHPHEEIIASASYDSHIHLQWDDPDGDWCIFQKLHPKLPLTSLTISHPSSTSASKSAPTETVPPVSDTPSADPAPEAAAQNTPQPTPAAPSATPGQIASFNALVQALMPSKEEQAADDALKVPPLLEDETVWSLAWSPCGKFLASGGDLGGIRIWARTGNNPDSPLVEILHTAAHTRSCFTLSWSAGGDASSSGLGILASGGGDGKIIIWQIAHVPPPATGTPEARSDQPNQSTAGNNRQKTMPPKVTAAPIAAVRDAHGVADVNCLSWLQRADGRGRGVLASCADDGSVKVWRVVGDE